MEPFGKHHILQLLPHGTHVQIENGRCLGRLPRCAALPCPCPGTEHLLTAHWGRLGASGRPHGTPENCQGFLN